MEKNTDDIDQSYVSTVVIFWQEIPGILHISFVINGEESQHMIILLNMLIADHHTHIKKLVSAGLCYITKWG